MRINMLETKDGSPDGIRVSTYEAGRSYDIPDALGKIFIEQGWAREVADLAGPPEIKDDGLKTRNTASNRAGQSRRSKVKTSD